MRLTGKQVEALTEFADTTDVNVLVTHVDEVRVIRIEDNVCVVISKDGKVEPRT